MAVKRNTGLDAMRQVAQQAKPTQSKAAKSAPDDQVGPDGKARAVDEQGHAMTTTAVHIRMDHWRLLRRVAFGRANKTGGRASVSKIIGELIEQNRARLESEAGE